MAVQDCSMSGFPKIPPKDWWETGESYELFYPNKFRSVYAWKNGTVKPERRPWTDYNDLYSNNYLIESEDVEKKLCSLLSGDKCSNALCIPVTHLSHYTHLESARKIEKNIDIFSFSAKPKYPRKNSFVINVDHIPWDPWQQQLHQPILPGYLTWWGISTIEWYESAEGSQTRIMESLLRNGGQNNTFYLPPYLQYIDGRGCSVYGGNSFTFPIQKLIESYKESRSDCFEEDEKKVYFKKAGTLRYRFEICYVILVCMGMDLSLNSHIASMEGAGQPDESGQVVSNGFIAEDGEVIDAEEKLFFVSEYPIKSIYSRSKPYSRPKPPTFYSWDTLNFAFYYPCEGGALHVEAPGIQRNPYVQHDAKSCHFQIYGKKCPDQIVSSSEAVM